MCGEVEIYKGKCFYCNRYTDLKRKYFHYNIGCCCHSPKHFDLIYMCHGCTPKMPSYTSVLLKTGVIESFYFELNNEKVYFKDLQKDSSRRKYNNEEAIWIPTEYIREGSEWTIHRDDELFKEYIKNHPVDDLNIEEMISFYINF